jgi:hypothetical protein
VGGQNGCAGILVGVLGSGVGVARTGALQKHTQQQYAGYPRGALVSFTGVGLSIGYNCVDWRFGWWYGGAERGFGEEGVEGVDWGFYTKDLRSFETS